MGRLLLQNRQHGTKGFLQLPGQKAETLMHCTDLVHHRLDKCIVWTRSHVGTLVFESRVTYELIIMLRKSVKDKSHLASCYLYAHLLEGLLTIVFKTRTFFFKKAAYSAQIHLVTVLKKFKRRKIQMRRSPCTVGEKVCSSILSLCSVQKDPSCSRLQWH